MILDCLWWSGYKYHTFFSHMNTCIIRRHTLLVISTSLCMMICDIKTHKIFLWLRQTFFNAENVCLSNCSLRWIMNLHYTLHCYNSSSSSDNKARRFSSVYRDLVDFWKPFIIVLWLGSALTWPFCGSFFFLLKIFTSSWSSSNIPDRIIMTVVNSVPPRYST